MRELHQEVNSGSRNVTRVVKTFIATTVQTRGGTYLLETTEKKRSSLHVCWDGCDQVSFTVSYSITKHFYFTMINVQLKI